MCELNCTRMWLCSADRGLVENTGGDWSVGRELNAAHRSILALIYVEYKKAKSLNTYM